MPLSTKDSFMVLGLGNGLEAPVLGIEKPVLVLGLETQGQP